MLPSPVTQPVDLHYHAQRRYLRVALAWESQVCFMTRHGVKQLPGGPENPHVDPTETAKDLLLLDTGMTIDPARLVLVNESIQLYTPTAPVMLLYMYPVVHKWDFGPSLSPHSVGWGLEWKQVDRSITFPRTGSLWESVMHLHWYLSVHHNIPPKSGHSPRECESCRAQVGNRPTMQCPECKANLCWPCRYIHIARNQKRINKTLYFNAGGDRVGTYIGPMGFGVHPREAPLAENLRGPRFFMLWADWHFWQS